MTRQEITQMKKILFSTLMMFFVPFLALASNEPTELIIKMKSGDVKSFLLSDKPVITFDSEHLNVTSTDFSTTYDNVESIYFQDNTTTSINNADKLPQAQFVFKFTDSHTITITGCSLEDRLTVYSLNGMNISADVERTSDSIVINLENLPKGFYIIRVNSQSFKIQKR